MKKITIGVIVPEIRHPFFAAILDGIEDVTFKKGCALHVGQSKEDPKREVAAINALIANGIDGLLISISQHTKNCECFQKIPIPLVFFDRVMEGIEASRVFVDDFDGAYKATEYLILSGYKRIAHIAGPGHLIISKRRLKGYETAIKKYNLPVDNNLVVAGNLDENAGQNGMKKLLRPKEKPDAVFAVNDPVATGALMHIKKVGLHIHDDIGLVGFSDNPVAAILDPPLTTIAQPRYEIGATAAKILIEHINGHKDPVEKMLQTKLIIRQSS